jgi:hypothetical protein
VNGNGWLNYGRTDALLGVTISHYRIREKLAIVHAVADRPLVHIQSDVIHSLHGKPHKLSTREHK